MKKNILLAIIFCLSFFEVNAQGMKSVVRGEAYKMAKALAAMDIPTYITYTYPSLLDEKNGAQKIKQGIDSINKFRQMIGLKVESISIGQVSEIVENKKILQATVPQTISLKSALGNLTTTTTLVALSNDGGKKWYFVEGMLFNNAKTKAKLPALSSKIVIPPMLKPKLDGFIPPKEG